MHLDSLKFLTTVAQCGSTRKAADILNTSAQNVSRVLRQLENEWDIALFERSAHGMKLTTKGELTLNFAQKTLEQHDKLLAVLHPPETNAENLTGQITLFGSTLSNSCFLNQLLAQFVPHYPNIQVTLKENDILTLPPNDSSDATKLCFLPRFKDKSFLSSISAEVIPLFFDQIVMLVSVSSPLAKQNSISLKTVVQQPMVILSKNNLEDCGIYPFIEPYKDQMKAPFITGSHQYFSLITQGNFVAMATKVGYENYFSPTEKATIAAVPIRDEKCTFEHCLYVYNSQNLSEAEQYFIAFVKKYFNLPAS